MNSAPAVQTKRRVSPFWRKAIIVAVLGLAAAAALTLGRVPHTAADDLIYEQASRGSIESVVTAVGKVKPRSYVDVGAQASGQLRRIFVAIGDRVEAGQILAEIDPRVQEAAISADRAELAALEANLSEREAIAEFAKRQFDRNGPLLNMGISQATLDANARDAKVSIAQINAIRAQIEQMRSEIESSELELTYTRIAAPMSGTVVSIEAKEGQTLNANYSAPEIMRIADLDTMTVWTEVSEADVTRVTEGMVVRFTTLGHGERSWSANLRQILPTPQSSISSDSVAGSVSRSQSSSTGNVVLYTALFDVVNEGYDLRPEMTAQVSFVIESQMDTILVPVSALKDVSGGEYTGGDSAFVDVGMHDGTVERRRVHLGIRTRSTAQALDGVEAGEYLVTGVQKNNAGQSLIGVSL